MFRHHSYTKWIPDFVAVREAVIEMVYSVFFSTLPIWLIPVVTFLYVFSLESLRQDLFENVRSGELFLYTAALVGPIFYTTTYKYAQTSMHNGFRYSIDMPLGRSMAAFCVVLIVLTVAAFGYMRFPEAKYSIEVEEVATVAISGTLFATSIIAFIITSYNRNVIYSSTPEIMRSDTEDFVRKFKDVD